MSSEDKILLIDEYLTLKTKEYDKRDDLINKIEVYTSRNGDDSQLNLIRQTLLLRKTHGWQLRGRGGDAGCFKRNG